MYALKYVQAKSVKEAAALLSANPEAKLLAGGMTLIPTLKQRLARPSDVVDLGGVKELAGIKVEGNNAGLAGEIGDPQVRNCGTIGGSVANNDPAADYPAAVLGLNATVVTTKREIPADKYFQGLFTTALGEGEIIVRVDFPLVKRAAYSKFHHPASGYAMAGVFIAQAADGGLRVAVTGAGPGVFRWKQAEAALAKSLKPAALEGLKLDSANFNSDIHADRDYRANLVRVMAARAVAKLSGKK
jgi:aerobic carbon-monoxide dehydrogenase medium subunit